MPIINENLLEEELFDNNIPDDGGLAFYYRSRFIPEISDHIFTHINTYMKNMKNRNVSNYKVYKSSTRIKLSSVESLKEDTFFKTIYNRKSIRSFYGEEISFEKFSKLISSSYGINGKFIDYGGDKKLLLRTVPSAGGLYPIEIYINIFNVENIPAGLYHYNPISLELELIKLGNNKEEIKRLYQGLEEVDKASAIIMMTGVFNRTVKKYGERGWRFLYLDAGHLGQNIYLTATRLGIGVFTLGGGFDSDINNFLEINENNEVYLYAAIIGSLGKLNE